MDFVHLHVHTHYSMQSSPVFPAELFSACGRLGMKSIAVTDYCAAFNMPELFTEAENAG
ncbi:MAG: PHP domain-containing protein, partial [Chlorobiaceae bacterium]|nr:PHP domain-containing protein [Chlorobiaceae bacterium]